MIAKNMYVYINPCLAEDTVPNPQPALPPRSMTYVPRPLNFVQPKIKNVNLREKEVLVTNTLAYLWSRADSALTTASHCWEEATQSLCSPRWPVARPWMGLVLNLGAAGVTCLPSHCLFETWMLPGNSGIAHAPKETLGSRGNAFSANGHSDRAQRRER